jgi:hypothetical protein
VRSQIIEFINNPSKLLFKNRAPFSNRLFVGRFAGPYLWTREKRIC